MSVLRRLVTVLGILSCASSIQAQGGNGELFENPVELMRLDPFFQPGRSPNWGIGSAMACGDIDGDGLADVAVSAPLWDIGSAQDTGAVGVFRGSDRRLVEWIAHPDPIRDGLFGTGLVIEDFDQDGYGDLAVLPITRGAGDTAIWVYFGPTLDRVQVVTPPLPGIAFVLAHSFKSGDLDQDGFPDILFGNPSAYDPTTQQSGAFFVLYGPDFQRSTTVAPPTKASQAFGRAVAAGDVDGDGWPDVAVSDPYIESILGKVWVYYGPSFTQFTTLPNPDNKPAIEYGSDLVIGDFNHDGFGDLAVGALQAVGGTGAGDGAVFLYWGPAPSRQNMLRLLNTPRDQWGGEFGSSLGAADIDEDGITDLLVGARSKGRLPAGGGEVDILLAPTLSHFMTVIFNGSFQESVNFGMHFAIGDVTGDGHLDLALGAPGADLWLGRAYVGDLSKSLWPFASYQAEGPLIAKPTLQLEGFGVPRIAGQVRLTVRDLPGATRAWLAVADDYTARPFDPDAGGGNMDLTPQPYLLVRPPLTWKLMDESAPSPPGRARSNVGQLTMRIPNEPALLGLRLRMQAFAFHGGIDEPRAHSNGLVMTINSWPE